MPVPNVPTKTSRGHDELRTRAQRLGQRHRTVLFLVDGRRTLAEVLSLAHQAGAQTVHFEELVRLGLVEIPEEVSEAIDSGPGGLDAPTLTSITFDVPHPQVPEPGAALPAVAPIRIEADVPAAAIDADRLSSTSMIPPQPLAGPSMHAAVDEPISLQDPVPLARRVVEPEAPLPVQLVESVDAARSWSDTIPLVEDPKAATWVPPALPDAAVHRSSRRSGVRTAASGVTAVLHRALGRGRAKPIEDLPPVTPKIEKPSSEQQLIARVQELLLDTLRIDAPVFAALTHGKVRAAQTQRQLIEIVWEIEGHRSHARMSREELISLQQARELLGMGNTLVAGDGHTDLDDDWPTTQPRL